jgi:hypothetical protein
VEQAWTDGELAPPFFVFRLSIFSFHPSGFRFSLFDFRFSVFTDIIVHCGTELFQLDAPGWKENSDVFFPQK